VASLEVGTGYLDPHSRLHKSGSLAIQSADCSDQAFCLSLAMGGPQLLTVDQGIRGILRQLAVQDGGDKYVAVHMGVTG
jgi:hypothetical protein